MTISSSLCCCWWWFLLPINPATAGMTISSSLCCCWWWFLFFIPPASNADAANPPNHVDLAKKYGGGGVVAAGQLWCVAKNNAEDGELQAALDWACGPGGAGCGPIQSGGPCFDGAQQDVQSLASFAFNGYFLLHQSDPSACDFSGCAALTSIDPSYGVCKFPSSLSVGNGSFIGSSMTPIDTGSGPFAANRSGGARLYRAHWMRVAAPLVLMVLAATR